MRIELAVASQCQPAPPETLGQHFHKVDRTVLTARAANGHRDVASVVLLDRRDPLLQKVLDVFLHAFDLGRLAQVVLHRCIASGERAQIRFVVRVGEHAHIENEVGIGGDAALESKGLEHQGELGGGCAHQCFDVGLQLRRSQQAGVDHMGTLAQLGQQFAFVMDGFDQGFVALQLGFARERVLASGFGIASQQRVRGGVQKDGLDRHAHLAQHLELFGHQVQ